MRRLVAVGPAPMGWRDNLRLVAPVYLGLIGFAAAGRFLDGLLVALGAYIVLFGAGRPGPRRLRTFLAAAGLMLVAVGAGILVAGSFWLTLVAYLAASGAAVAVSVAFDLGPPGPYFFALMVGGGTLLAPAAHGPLRVLPLVALGNALAIAFGMGDLLVDRYGSERRAVGMARDAVDRLETATADTPVAELIDERLRPAAAAVYRAWETVIAGIGATEGAAAARIVSELRSVHRRYRSAYLDVVRRVAPDGGQPGRGAATVAGQPADALSDARRSALGPPSVGYRFATAFYWPSPTLVTLARVASALVAACAVSLALGDRHPFWTVLVVVLVLSYPGDQQRLTLRGVQRLLGTLAGVGVFAALLLLPVRGGVPVTVAAVCVLLWFVSRYTARNYLFGTVFITLLALVLTVPLTRAETPLQLALDRWRDTGIAVAIALVALWAIGPGFTAALLRRSIRRLAGESVAVLADLDAGRPLLHPLFVEHRRRLQHSLMAAGTPLDVAGTRQLRKSAQLVALEDLCARVGYLVLGVTWEPALCVDGAPFSGIRARLADVAVARLDPPSVESERTALSDAVAGGPEPGSRAESE